MRFGANSKCASQAVLYQDDQRELKYVQVLSDGSIFTLYDNFNYPAAVPGSQEVLEADESLPTFLYADPINVETTNTVTETHTLT